MSKTPELERRDEGALEARGRQDAGLDAPWHGELLDRQESSELTA
jgi:hypothetical protein